MLIIAIPKSASTSLLHTLGDMYNLPSTQDFELVRNVQIPDDFNILGRYHSDIRELEKIHIDKWLKKDGFFKQHIPPTINNLKLLYPYKKVILLRDPQEIILSYKRAEEKHLHKNRKEFIGCKTKADWLERADDIGLTKELWRFKNEWENNKSNQLIVRYDSLVKNPNNTIKIITEYFGLEPISKQVRLQKMRYSRHNRFERFFYKFKRKFYSIFN